MCSKVLLVDKISQKHKGKAKNLTQTAWDLHMMLKALVQMQVVELRTNLPFLGGNGRMPF